MNGRKLYDDSQPIHAALVALIDDGYATDKQRQTARLALSMIETSEDELDKELRRWQDAIRDKLIDMGAPDWKIDGAGCDSGDPLDFTLAEVGQGVGYFIDQLEGGYWPTLRDRADGVKGHYCIGRLINPEEPYWEYWNKGQWASAGEVFNGKEAAEAQLRELRAATPATTTAAEQVTSTAPPLRVGAPSTPAVIKQAAEEIIEMDLNGRYDPHDPNSRQAIISILSRHFGAKQETHEDFERPYFCAVRALRHLKDKNHDFIPLTCDGCKEIALFLTEPGYRGDEYNPIGADCERSY